MNDGKAPADNSQAATSAVVSREMKLAFELLEKKNRVLERFDWIVDERAPVAQLPPGVVITRSMDASTHFQAVMDEVPQIYQKITGKAFDINSVRSSAEMREAANKKTQG